MMSPEMTSSTCRFCCRPADTTCAIGASVVSRSSSRTWPPAAALEATLAWVDWFNVRRLFSPIGDIPPTEYKAPYYAQAAVA